jgi:Orsellinic acid/F9775 biosynthesis cluster protein D
VFKHLQRWHQDLGLGVRKELEHYFNELDLVEPKDIINPNNQDVIDGLELHNGNKCDVPGCTYICSKESMAMLHARKHGWTKGKPYTWVKTYVQVRCRA